LPPPSLKSCIRPCGLPGHSLRACSAYPGRKEKKRSEREEGRNKKKRMRKIQRRRNEESPGRNK